MTKEEFNATARIAEIYFNIAAEAIGEDEVRKKRDLILDGKVSSQEETVYGNCKCKCHKTYKFRRTCCNRWRNKTGLQKEFEELFMVTDRTEMKGTAVNAKLKQAWEWIEQKVKHDYNQLPTNEEIELWAMRTYKEYEDSRWFEPLKLGATWMRDLVMSNSNIPKGEMDIHTVKEIIKLCTVLHDSPDSGIEEASGIDLVRMQLEDVLQTLKEKKK